VIGLTPRTPKPARAIAVLIELEGGQLVRFQLARPVTLRAGKDRGVLRVEIHGEQAWLTADG